MSTTGSTPPGSDQYLVNLVDELRNLPEETTWVEFKRNNSNPEDIGEYLSALSNSAALAAKANGYLVWGVENESHQAVGTIFRPTREKQGNEDLESWLLRLLSPKLHFRFFEVDYRGVPLVVLEVPRAAGRPVQFKGAEYIRVGSYRKLLKDYPELERELWRIFDTIPFEDIPAADNRSGGEVLQTLDYSAYFDLLRQPLPSESAGILERMAEDRMIIRGKAGGWDITNLGAILFAKNLHAFRGLSRKAVRVILYEGPGRLKTIREQPGGKGYGSGFEGLIEYINALLPRNEVIGKALREEVPMYPELAIRELVANALIHQDFSVTGAGPMVEIFDNRMEITNPGAPLVQPHRFLDTAPRSRNESLASFMRRVGVCEERGSGVDKVVSMTEVYQLPAPIFESPGESTKAILFAHRPFREMDREDRVRACYLHASLRYVQRNPMTNASLRERFGIEERNSATVSRIIRDALEHHWIKPEDPGQGKRYAKYVPIWA